MVVVSALGSAVLGRWRLTRDTSALAAATLGLAVRPRYWPRTVREVLGRQILFTAIEALPLVSWIAVLTGLAVVAQAQAWLTAVGQTAMLGPLLVAILIREVGPLLVNLIVIGRSGTAVAAELAGMRVGGEVRVLDAMGLDPTVYLVLPRAIGLMVSVFCLTIVFAVVSLAAGAGFGLLLDATRADPAALARGVAEALDPRTFAALLMKTLWPGMTTGVVCCMEGLAAEASVTEVPQAVTRAVVRSIKATLVISALVSGLMYI